MCVYIYIYIYIYVYQINQNEPLRKQSVYAS